MNIADIDKNFDLGGLTKENISWIENFDNVIQIYGLSPNYHDFPLCRVEPDFAKQMPRQMNELSYHTSGVRLRFKTNSSYIALKAIIRSSADMPHMPRSGSSGFDLYYTCGDKQVFKKFFAPASQSDKVVGELDFNNNDLKEITIDFPLYNGVNYVAVGIEKDAVLEKADPYRFDKPIVFYGSSITQGGCANRPGNSYTLMLSRMLNADIWNMGFSGSARAEPILYEYISKLSMKLLVMDYDHNAPNVEHLVDTHYTFYNAIRTAQPNLPIVLITKPDCDSDLEMAEKRKAVIYQTYQRAKDSGDKNIYFIDGQTLFGTDQRDACTVDTCHPNDLGFYRMASTIYPVLKGILG